MPLATAESIRTALRAGRKIEAIKLYREFSGVDLAEAKEFVERLEMAGGADPQAPSIQGAPAPAEEQIRQAISEGRKIEAVQLYREWTKLGLKEAKENIDRIAEAMRLGLPADFAPRPSKSAAKGCLAVLCLCVAGLAAPSLWFLIR